jgi:hypothetical protein
LKFIAGDRFEVRLAAKARTITGRAGGLRCRTQGDSHARFVAITRFARARQSQNGLQTLELCRRPFSNP